MIPKVSRHGHSKVNREASLSREVEELDFELGVLQRFLSAAPKLREESRYLIPPPEEMVMSVPQAPNRAELRRVQRQSNYNAIKLILLLSIFFATSLWFVERLLTVMR